MRKLVQTRGNQEIRREEMRNEEVRDEETDKYFEPQNKSTNFN